MLKITLDTNCVINLLDFKAETPTSVDELSEIIKYGLESNANIAITTRVETDFEGDKDKERQKEMVRKIQMLPIIGTVARFGSSKWGGGDVWGGEEHTKIADELTKIIFPALKKEDAHFKNKINDIDHLVGHLINKRDIFVTDDKEILKKAETLKASLGLVVMSPKQTLEYLNLKGDKAVLLEEFSEKFSKFKELIMKIISTNKLDDVTKEMMTEYEETRKWLIRKYSILKDGISNYKHTLSSVSIGTQRVFDQDDIMSLQLFNEKLNGILGERNPFNIPEIVSYNRFDYGFHSISEERKISNTSAFLDKVEDTLLGYLGKLEDK